MLGTLLKHEYKVTAKNVVFVYMASVLVAIFSLAGMAFKITWMQISGSALLVLVGVATVFVTYVLIFVRFYRSMYLSEGYLTNTIPVKSSHLLASKFIVSLTWLIVSAIVLALTIVGTIFFVSSSAGVDENILEEILAQLNMPEIRTIITAVVIFGIVILINMIYYIAICFFACTITNTKYMQGGVGIAVLAFLGIYAVSQILESIVTVAVPFGITITSEGIRFSTQSMLSSMELYEESAQLLNVPIGLGSAIFEIIMIGILLYFTNKFIRNKINIK